MLCKKVMVWFLTAILAMNTLLCLPVVAGAEGQDARDGIQHGQADMVQEKMGLSEEKIPFNLPTSATNSVYNALMTSLAVVSNTTLVINPGETYEFENIDTAGRSITSNASTKNDISYDLVTYKADGSINVAYLDHTSTSTVVPGGGSSFITATGAGPLVVSVKPQFNYSTSENPALERVTVFKDESYRIVNEGVDSRSILHNASTADKRRFDYAKYKEDGGLVVSGLSSIAHPTLGDGEELIITGSTTNAVTFGFPYGKYSIENTGEPAYARVTLNQGESYQFINVGTRLDTVESDGTSKDKLDYVVYLANGTESSRGSGTSSKPQIGVDRYAVITQVTANPVTYGAPYRNFIARPVGGDAISRVEFEAGKSYIFHNNGTLLNPIYNNSRKAGNLFDYVIYKPDGTVYAYGFNSQAGPLIPASGYAIVTVIGPSPIIFDYTDDFSWEPSSEPAFLRVTLSKGESYAYTNISDRLRNLHSTARTVNGKFDVVLYKADGTEQSRRSDTSTAPQVGAGKKALLTVTSDTPITFGGIYRSFRAQGDDGDPLQQTTLEPGDSYIFWNHDSQSNTLRRDKSSGNAHFDSASYRGLRLLTSDHFNNTVDPEIVAGGEAIVTNVSDRSITFRYSSKIEAMLNAQAAFHRITLKRGETRKFINVSTMDKALDVISVSGMKWNYMNYRSDGTVYSQASDTTQLPLVQAGGYAVVTTVSDMPVTYGAVLGIFDVEDAQAPTDSQVTIKQGESYVFHNTGAQASSLTTDAAHESRVYDYVVYGTDSGVNSKVDGAGMGASLPEISLGAGKTLIITVTSPQAVTVHYSNEIKAEPGTEPALLKTTLSGGKQGTWINRGSQEAPVLTNAKTAGGTYQYTVADQAGKVIREHKEAIDNLQQVPGKASIRLAVASATPVVTFGAPYRVFAMKNNDDSKLDELIELIEKEADFTVGQQGKYRFTPKEDGIYRFAVWEKSNYAAQQPIVTLYTDPDFSNQLVSSTEQAQIYGWNYTVLEYEMKAGQTVYVKLTETNSGALQTVIKAAHMALGKDTLYEYGKGNRLNKVIFSTGDQIELHYDLNGNVSLRLKKVFPFTE
ncbi:hypothetical protein B4V02_00835 [Paenibacillus kribbensis]|uniref:Copper amine oxidase n=1 Tax=Paenibacillus kribbensis TaxID=172713 RepID=A0A222WGS1_9BACL|nr:hypothetical protein [Paenibacillus kribbensis]ASR45355.1 hypothetical protein B4V02_00835 [Paenibacillus kribbensis]